MLSQLEQGQREVFRALGRNTSTHVGNPGETVHPSSTEARGRVGSLPGSAGHTVGLGTGVHYSWSFSTPPDITNACSSNKK